VELLNAYEGWCGKNDVYACPQDVPQKPLCCASGIQEVAAHDYSVEIRNPQTSYALDGDAITNAGLPHSQQQDTPGPVDSPTVNVEAAYGSFQQVHTLLRRRSTARALATTTACRRHSSVLVEEHVQGGNQKISASTRWVENAQAASL